MNVLEEIRAVREIEGEPEVGGPGPRPDAALGWSLRRVRATVAALAASTLFGVALFARRPGPLEGPWLLELTVLLGLGACLFGLATRPLWRPPAHWGLGALVAALALPALGTTFPAATHLAPAGSALGCLAFGVALAAPAGLFLAWIRDRGVVHWAAAGAAAGTLGVAALHVHCAGDAAAHLWLGHASVPFVVGLAAAALALHRERAAQRR